MPESVRKQLFTVFVTDRGIAHALERKSRLNGIEHTTPSYGDARNSVQFLSFDSFIVEWRDALRPVGKLFVLVNMASKKICCLLGNPSKLCIARGPLSTVAVRGNASWEPVDKVTHTGQKFDENDRRLARFVDRQKEVNNNWAIKLIDEVPPKPTKDRIVACDGGGGPLGHPKVYINLDKPGNHSCGYCGLRFYKEDHHH